MHTKRLVRRMKRKTLREQIENIEDSKIENES